MRRLSSRRESRADLNRWKESALCEWRGGCTSVTSCWGSTIRQLFLVGCPGTIASVSQVWQAESSGRNRSGGLRLQVCGRLCTDGCAAVAQRRSELETVDVTDRERTAAMHLAEHARGGVSDVGGLGGVGILGLGKEYSEDSRFKMGQVGIGIGGEAGGAGLVLVDGRTSDDD